MSPFRHLAPVVLGLTVNLSSGLQFAAAEEAVVQHFGNWKITIQPGVRAEGLRVPPVPVSANTIRLVSQAESVPVDQETVTPLPPAPAAPENVASNPESTPPTGAVSKPVVAPCRSVDPLALVQIYPQVYNSIPFSRAEYEANPSYRHDATMEFLFGQLRQTVIQRSHTTVNQKAPAIFAPSPSYSPYGFNSYSYPFQNGYYQPYSLW